MKYHPSCVVVRQWYTTGLSRQVQHGLTLFFREQMNRIWRGGSPEHIFYAYRHGRRCEIGTSLLSFQRLSSLICIFFGAILRSSRGKFEDSHKVISRLLHYVSFLSVLFVYGPTFRLRTVGTVLMPDYNFPLYRLFWSFLHPFLPNPRSIPLKHSLDQLLHEIIFVCFMGCVEQVIVSTANCVSRFFGSPRFRDRYLDLGTLLFGVS